MSATVLLLIILAEMTAGTVSLPFPHPVVIIGHLVGYLERRLYPPDRDRKRDRRAGLVLVVLVVSIVWGVTVMLLAAAHRMHPLAGNAVVVALGWTVLAPKELAAAAATVRRALEEEGDLTAARRAVSRIVGRDTAALDREGIIAATVETVAENLGDGVVAPLCCLIVGGVPLAMVYKAINTMDSMIGYKNDRYRHFGTAAARLDDVVNYLPARLAAMLIIAAGWLTGRDAAAGRRILRRDRRAHASPNSGWPEAAMAGVLGVRLGGPNRYFGVTVEKPFIGDARVPLAGATITAANQLMITGFLLLAGGGLWIVF
ncbi:MAG: cobalamin biosynthesis protein CobD [Deltaproteobacteria bacterium]|nr:cobalamin biosynthesis protein CobD [Candidatus Anaeroferrophillacea bacterium]